MAKLSGIAAILAAVLLLTACDAGPAGSPGPDESQRPPAGTVPLRITTQVGEQCPHIPVTPDPRCDPKPRPDTAFEVRDSDGDVVTSGRTGADGTQTVYVPPGAYVVRGEQVPDWLITPKRPVTASGTEEIPVPLTYTNGIQ